MTQGSQTSQPKPVAYDADGKPLYAAPPPPPERPYSHVTAVPESHEGHNFDPRMRSQYGNEPDVRHHTREYEPVVEPMSDELKDKCQESRRRYPGLNLSEGEYVIVSIRRHPIGLLIPVVVSIIVIALLLAGMITYPMIAEDATGEATGMEALSVAALCLILIVGISGYLSVWVYLRNTFYLTNESVIQEIQHSIFSKHEQTVSLGSVEDASYQQTGVLQTALNYGTIRLSTEGNETTYRFSYVDNPKKQIAALNNAIEAFKNGRPVTGLPADYEN